MRLVYIAGSGRSGSTLVARVLGGFDSVVNLGELKFFWDRGTLRNQLCGCSVPFLECPFWRPIVAECDAVALAPRVVSLQSSLDRVRHALAQQIPVAGNRVSASFRNDPRAQEYVGQLGALYDAVSRRVGPDTTLVDASKSVPYLMSVRGIEGLDITVLHVVRDSRSVAMSWKRRRVRPEITDSETEMPTMTARSAAINWNIANGMADRLSSLSDIGYVRLRHEDIVAEPIRELKRLAAPLGLTDREVEARFSGPGMLAASADHTVSGNPSRFEAGNITLRSDADWKSELSVTEAHLVTTLTSPLLVRYGYSLSRSGST